MPRNQGFPVRYAIAAQVLQIGGFECGAVEAVGVQQASQKHAHQEAALERGQTFIVGCLMMRGDVAETLVQLLQRRKRQIFGFGGQAGQVGEGCRQMGFRLRLADAAAELVLPFRRQAIDQPRMVRGQTQRQRLGGRKGLSSFRKSQFP